MVSSFTTYFSCLCFSTNTPGESEARVEVMGQRVKVVKRKKVRWWRGLRPVRGGGEVGESDLWEEEKEKEEGKGRRRSEAEAGRTTTTGKEEEAKRGKKVVEEDIKIGKERRFRLKKKKKKRRRGENMILFDFSL